MPGTGKASPTNLLDTSLQISALGKLKFRKCAPISGLPGIGFLLRKPRIVPETLRDPASGDRAGGPTAAPHLRVTHGSGGTRPRRHCIHIVISAGPVSGHAFLLDPAALAPGEPRIE